MTLARITALLAIAAVAVALGLVHAALDEDAHATRVPAGAHAGQLTLDPCTYLGLKADCGTLVVPENRDDPGSRLIALPVKRIHARSATPGEPIFRLEGGPGHSNMTFPLADRYVDNHDLVLVGYRGVDGSVKLDCPEVTDARRHSGDLLGARSIDASAEAFGDCATRLRGEGIDLGGYSLAERVDDMEAARRALRYERVDLLSESAGTRTAMVYAWRHPRSIRRSIMVGVNPPGHFLFDSAATVAQLKRLRALDGRFDDVPRRWGPLPIRRGNVQVASFIGLMESSAAAAPLSAPMTLDAWRAADEGDASGLWFQSFASSLMLPRMMVWGDTASVGRADAAAAERHFARRPRGGSPLGDALNRYLWAAGRSLHEWPTNHDDDAYTRVRTSGVETLLVSGTLDGSTPLSDATRDLLRHLPNGHQVVLEGFGHTMDFWNNQTAANSRMINAFFDRGRVDTSLYKPQRVDMEPGTTQTALAKMIAGALLALALITVLSLAWLPRRRFGVKASAYLRSAHAALVGLGGWALAALVTMVAFPDTPIDAELLAVLSIGLAAGLAVHWASNGALVAIPGAVLGAWLGFAAAGSPLGLITAVVGAVAAANLAVIVREVVPRRERVRAVAPAAAPSSSPLPSER